jgi:mRNA interferase RelE/StbE
MASYRLSFKSSVARDLRSIPNQDITKILARIEALTENPRPQGCEKLSGLPRYRVRQGVYRIVYEIQDDVLLVLVVKVGHRKDVYR